MSMPEAICLLHQAVCYLIKRACAREAYPLLELALTICEQRLGPEHPDTGSPIDRLARVFEIQDKDEQADPLYRPALSICAPRLAPLHPHPRQAPKNYPPLL